MKAHEISRGSIKGTLLVLLSTRVGESDGRILGLKQGVSQTKGKGKQQGVSKLSLFVPLLISCSARFTNPK